MKIKNYAIFKRIIGFGKPYTRYFALSITFMLLNTVFEGVSIFSIVPFVDKVLTGKKIEFTCDIRLPFMDRINELLAYLSSLDRMMVFKYIALFTLIIFIIKGIAFYYAHVFMEILGQKIVKDIRCKIFEHVESMSIDFFTQGKTGNLMSRVTSDVQMVLEIISGRFASTLIELPKFIVYAVIAIVIDWKLVAGMVFLPFLVLPIILIGKKIRSLSRRSQTLLADLNSILFEVLTGIKIVQAFLMEKTELQRFITENIRYYKTRIKLIRLDTILSPLTDITGIIVCLGIMLYRIPSIIEGQMSIGTFTLQAAAIVAMVKPLKTLGKINALMQRAFGACERIFEILDTKATIVEQKNPVHLPVVSRDIKFDNVSFRYETNGSSKSVLENISITIKKGDIAAFVGPSGAGKTTILNLVPRFYDPEQGRIMIDGIDLRDVALSSLRGQIGIVTQETILFNESVFANIAYGTTEFSPDEVERAAKTANAHDFIQNLPEGYKTIIGEKGVKLSGGQRQRISIARAILKDPAILILDEATSALDTESERLVQAAIDRLMEHRTVLVVAHRLSTVMHANVIFVIENGKILASGTHGQLLKTSQLYQKLYEMQFNMNTKAESNAIDTEKV